VTGVLTIEEGWRRRAGFAPAARRRAGRRSPYAVVGILFWLVMSARTWQMTIAADFAQHAAAIERIKADWLHPANPLLDIPGTGSPYFTPYTVCLGLVAKGTGLAGWQVLKACGPLNLALIVTGIGAFARTLSARRWAPVLALGAFVLLWGTWFTEWSGFLGLQSMTRGLTYPSAFGVGLTFWAWTWAARLERRGGPLWSYGGLGALAGIILLVHPFTAMAAVIGVLSIAVGRQRKWDAGWLLTAATTLAAAGLWPYFSVFSLVGDPTLDPMHHRLYQHFVARYGLALAGLPALLFRLRRRALDPLVVMFVLDCAVAAYGWFSGHYSYGRVFGLLLVPLQFALAVELAERRLWGILLPLATAAGCAGLLAQGGPLIPKRFEPFQLPRITNWPSYQWAAQRIPVGDVVLADGYQATHVLPAYGVFLVAPTWPDPSTTAAERARRWRSVHTCPAPGNAQCSVIISRYHAQWLLLDPGRPVPPGAKPVATGPKTGERLYRLGTP
jgi:hypothetical protein